MANPNPFPPPPMFNGQYAPQPYYQPYNASAPTPSGAHFPQGMQHPPPFPAQASNSQRFEANSNTSTPPPPLPFLFPPNVNLENLRKHIEAHGLPPPPPPPPGQAFPATFAPNLHPSAASVHPQQPPLPQFPQSRPPFPPIPSPAATQSPFRAQNGYTAPIQQDTPQRAVTAQQQQPPSTFSVPNFDGTAASRVSSYGLPPQSTSGDQPAQWHYAAVSQNEMSRTVEKGQDQESSKEEKHHKARAAISDFISAGITYQNLIDEGIKPPVLNQLFAELGLDRHTTLLAPKQPVQDSASASHPIVQTTTSEQPPDTRQTTATPQPAVLDPAMERKDRIARLLAMKKGQAIPSAKSSQSASPAPVDASTRPIPRPAPVLAQTTPARTPQQLAVNTIETVVTEPQQSTAPQPLSAGAAENAEKRFNSLPTPVREEIRHHGFSIPGLFLTSADEAFEPQSAAITPAPAEPKSLKRSPEPFATDAMPHAKRQVSQVVDTPQEVASASENAMVDSADVAVSSPLAKQIPEPKDLPASSDSDKPVDTGIPASRSKINQDKLKNRMAALRADLMRKNTRKKALQDGMPELAAEVERTRERLLEQQTRLSVVRKDIETKNSELAQARDEEDRILQEIHRLENQLADGESGQKQFTNELTQLNDQIVADTNESTLSPQATARSSPQAELTEPRSEIVPQAVPMDVGMEVVSTTEALDEQLEFRNLAGQPLGGGEAHSRLPSHDQQRTETDYSPEQEDLDRQLNFQIASSAARDQDMANASEDNLSKGASLEPKVAADVLPQTQISNATTPHVDQSVDNSDDDRMSIDETSDAGSDGSASMSDGSDDYEPAAEMQDVQILPLEDNDDYDPENPVQYQQPLETENDDYEPAEEVDVLNVDSLNGLRKEPDIPAETVQVSIADEDDDRSPRVQSTGATAVNGSIISNRAGANGQELPVTTSGPTTDDERLPLQQPTQPTSDVLQPTSDVLQPGQIDTLPEEEPPVVPRFKPYESPLSTLKSFRFHPQFNEHVKDGYRSLTYSNRIDAGKPLCPTELEGQMCTDVKCEEQHFGGMALSGT